MNTAYEIVCGLEVHVELATASKIFCGCAAAFGGEPNTRICPVCAGMPGALPVLNRRVVEYAVRTGLALGCEIMRVSRFDRKNYYYPDLPKAYQISQLYHPICRGGGLEIAVGGATKTVGIHEIHMEEDAGKLTHDPVDGSTLIDYNRCGVPLLEIVSEPDLRGAGEAVAYLEKLRETLLFLGVSDCKMQEGSLRADVNVSVRPAGSAEFGTRVEIKNMNSLRMIARAVEYEAGRQIELIERGGTVMQETRRWDDEQGRSLPMRSKEDVQDYRYFPEPDLPPVEVSEEWLADIRTAMPELPDAKRARYKAEFGLGGYNAEMMTSSREVAALFEAAAGLCGEPKEVANLIMTDLLRLMTETATLPEALAVDPAKLAALVRLITGGKINRGSGRQTLEALFRDGTDPERYVAEHGLAMVEDEALIAAAVEEALRGYPKSVADYRAGKEKALGFLMGQAMRGLGGKADPQVVRRVLLLRLQ